VVRQGGFSRAAKTVFATQSTVSKAVKQVEEELGMPLLDRGAHRCTLTAAGEIVYRRAQRMLAERDALVGELDELRGLRRGTLRLGLGPLGSSLLFAPMFAAYRSRYPGIDIRLVEHGSARLQEMVRTGELDLASSLLPTSDDFDWQDVSRHPMMAMLPAGHPLSRRESIELSALRELPLILFEPSFMSNRLILDAYQRRGIEPNVAARSGQVDFITELVAAGLGVAFLPQMIVEDRRHPGICAIRLAEPNVEFHMALIWRREGYLSHAARAWLELARTYRSNEPATLPDA
jgi:DNA-binding transcriptional LysR family regulator